MLHQRSPVRLTPQLPPLARDKFERRDSQRTRLTPAIRVHDSAPGHAGYLEFYLSCDGRWLELYVRGYGNPDGVLDQNGFGSPLALELYEGRLRLVYSADINDHDLVIVDLERARESNRRY